MRRRRASAFGCLLVLVPLGVAPSAGERIAVDASRVLRTMRGGIGASWHAIEEPIPGTHGGSGWGAYPPAEDEAAWKEIHRHAAWLGLDWCRVEVEQRIYEPRRGDFDWEGREMRILYRILDGYERAKVDVFFQQMWSNVEWNAFPDWRQDPVRRVHSGPLSLEDFGEGLAALVEHLVKRRGYTCLRWLSITNEPGHGWSWWLEPPGKPMALRPGLEAVRKALDRRGLALPLSAPDWTDLPALEPGRIDFDDLVGAYDIHTYHANFDGREGGYPMAVAEERLAAWARWAHDRGKPFFLSELGTMVFGWGNSHAGPASFESALKDAEMVVRGIAAGVDGFNRWSFLNRGDLDGHWQLLETWDREKKALSKAFAPKPNAYFGFGLLPRFTAKGSAVLECKVEPADASSVRHVFAAALRSPKGNLTLLVVNDGEADREAAFVVRGLERPAALHRYRFTRAERDRSDVKVEPGASFDLDLPEGRFADRLPAASVGVYTTYKLAHAEAGVTVE
ncbi:MAG: hypothetical protein HY721_35220 [Planctomycetes bacterium]|nr:hypothetical protein [Planctomycetota bacterium]